MALLGQMSLLEQVTYRPPSDDEVNQLDVQVFNQHQAALAAEKVAVEEISTRFDFETGRVRDLIGTGNFWSMMQAAEIFFDLMDWSHKNTNPYAREKFHEFSRMCLFPDGFWFFYEEHFTWGDYEVEGPWDYLQYQDPWYMTLDEEEFEPSC